MYQKEEGVLKLTPFYRIINLNKDDFSVERTNDERWEIVKEMFPETEADSMNIMLGPTDIDDVGIKLNRIRKPDEQLFPVLILHPRLRTLKHAELRIRDQDDIDWLRKVISSSVTAFVNSQRYHIQSQVKQKGNVRRDHHEKEA